jgi:hypothetical protein
VAYGVIELGQLQALVATYRRKEEHASKET